MYHFISSKARLREWLTLGALLLVFHISLVGGSTHDFDTTETSLISGVSGQVFSGDVFRLFDDSELIFSEVKGSKERIMTNIDCAQWAVVTTINKPTLSVLRLVALKDWCVVVVGDKKTPPTILPEGSNSYYLDVEEQIRFGAKFPDFFDLIPWNHFGRKNLGYLFALAHGAIKVWDFDDDNLLIGNIPSLPDLNNIQQVVRKNESCAAFNPYPYMGGPGTASMPSWPRGLPLDRILNPCPTEYIAGSPTSTIGVVQSLANHHPDVDAMYRLTRDTSFDFKKSESNDWLLLDTGLLAPYNAQATLILQPALWSLMLPVTVHGRVSDIWRSYIAQRLFWDVGIHLAFAPPHVDQFRNEHNYLGDLKAEDDLYIKSTALVNFLNEWRGTANSLPGRLEELVVALFERGYIELADVRFTQSWVAALIEVGYQFPTILGSTNLHRSPAVTADSALHGRGNLELEDTSLSSSTTTIATTAAATTTPMAAIKLFLMTMNDKLLLPQWLLFHGEIYGFNNLYVLDGSPDNSIEHAYLIAARDLWGVNVFFSKANLNQLTDVMGRYMEDNKEDCMFIVKLDADEFFLESHNSTHFVADSDQFLRLLPLTSDHAVAYEVMMQPAFPPAPPFKDPIDADRGYIETRRVQHAYKQVPTCGGFKKSKFNLGYHNKNNNPPANSIAVVHYHNLRYEDMVEMARKACISHGYLNSEDSKDVMLEKMSKYPREYTAQTTFASYHKVKIMQNYLMDSNASEAYYHNLEHSQLLPVTAVRDRLLNNERQPILEAAMRKIYSKVSEKTD